MSSQPTDLGDEPLSEEGFNQFTSAKPGPLPDPGLSPAGGPAYGTLGLKQGGTIPPEKQDRIFDETYENKYAPPDDRIIIPGQPSRGPDRVIPQHPNTLQYQYGDKLPNQQTVPIPLERPGGNPKIPASATDQGDTSDQPLTEDGFKQLLAKSTNVPSKGGPDPSQLQASTLTHFGYPHDETPDRNSYYGKGDRDNIETPGVSVALSPDERLNRLGVDSKKSTGKTFTYNGKTYVDDDTTDPNLRGRIDVFDPHGSRESDPSKAQVDKAGVNAYTITGVPYPKGGAPEHTAETASEAAAPAQTSQASQDYDQPNKPFKRAKGITQKADAQEPKEEEKVPENQPVSEQEDEVGYPAWSQRGGFVSPQQQAVQESAQRRPVSSAAGEVTSENPILANILAKIYEQYGGA